MRQPFVPEAHMQPVVSNMCSFIIEKAPKAARAAFGAFVKVLGGKKVVSVSG